MNDMVRSYRRSDLVRRIADAKPDMPIKHVRRIPSGQNNEVLLINGTWIFRFPRTLQGSYALARETMVLCDLPNHRLTIETPRPAVVHFPENRESEWFMGYPLIAGRPLTRSRSIQLSHRNLKTIADQLTQILQTVHSLPISPELRQVLEVVDPVSYWSDMFDRIQRHLFPLMRPEAQGEVTRQFTYHFETSNSQTIPLTLIHGDFGGSNILMTPNSRGICAVIDWGSVAIGDPGIDYASASTIHPEMLANFQSNHPALSPLLDRATFYRATFALQEALYGLEHGDANALAASLSEYV